MNRLVPVLVISLLFIGCGDNSPPEIMHVSELTNTNNAHGPYVVVAMVIDDVEVTAVELRYSVTGQEEVWLKMTNIKGDVWRAEIPGQPVGSNIAYYVVATDGEQSDDEIPVYPPVGEAAITFSIVP